MGWHGAFREWSLISDGVVLYLREWSLISDGVSWCLREWSLISDGGSRLNYLKHKIFLLPTLKTTNLKLKTNNVHPPLYTHTYVTVGQCHLHNVILTSGKMAQQSALPFEAQFILQLSTSTTL